MGIKEDVVEEVGKKELALEFVACYSTGKVHVVDEKSVLLPQSLWKARCPWYFGKALKHGAPNFIRGVDRPPAGAERWCDYCYKTIVTRVEVEDECERENEELEPALLAALEEAQAGGSGNASSSSGS